ncbi:hypothetical protein [Belliella kenyensis]|uniref:hypothetical protein n=1 Tax=Belliella kenyensis TaxID=1472724 RepID=UPI00338D718C
MKDMKAVVLNTSIPEKIEVKELALPELPQGSLDKVKAPHLIIEMSGAGKDVSRTEGW